MLPLRLSIAVASLLTLAVHATAAGPNLVMIVIDDLNDFVAPLGGYVDVLPDPEIRARVTPNLARLAELGATFVNAQTVHPACNASRAAVMTGISGETSGLSANDGGLNFRNYDALRYATTLPQHLKATRGYVIKTTGKVWHRNYHDTPDEQRDGTPPVAERAATEWDVARPFRQRARTPHRVVQQEWPVGGRGAGLRWSRLIPTTKRRRGEDDLSVAAWERLTDSMDDQLAAAWTAEQIATGTPDGTPQFLATGIFHPHLPWTAPGVFYDRFPLDQIALPKRFEGDRNDLPEFGLQMGIQTTHRKVLDATPDSDVAWRTAIQAYLASVSYADFAVGKILDAVEAANTDDNPANDWTVVLWSDHGWHLGEKSVWHKLTCWEEAARSNLMVYAPGVTQPGQRIDTPVDLLDLAPTIVELAGAEPLPQLQGDSLLRLVEDPDARPGTVAITSFGETEEGDNGLLAKKYGVRSKRFRLIHYQDGGQELYDLEQDPDSFYNLLHESNAAKIDRFGLSATQVEAVRRWHVGRLFEHLVRVNATDVFLDGQIDLAKLETDGRSFLDEAFVCSTAPTFAADLTLEKREDFLAALDTGGPSGSLHIGEVDGPSYELRLMRGGQAVEFARRADGEVSVLFEAPIAPSPKTAIAGPSFRLIADYRAATRSIELMVQDGLGVNRVRKTVRLDEPLAVGSRFGGQTKNGEARLYVLTRPAVSIPGDFNRDGRVDAADKSIFRDTQGSEVPVGSGADADFDGRIDDEDDATWRANYGRRSL